jgi:hypothetical protein
MRVAAAVLTLVLLACRDGPSPLPSDQIRARFMPGGDVNVIEVDAVDRLPLRKAELIAPSGSTVPATYLHVSPSPSVTAYQEFPNNPYAGNLFGPGNIGSSLSLPAGIGGAPQGRAQLLAMVSTASIPVPDRVEYRRGWADYRIRLDFGDPPGEVYTRDLAAPEPPPDG